MTSLPFSRAGAAWLATVAATLFLLLSSAAAGRAQDPAFAEGARIEVDVNMSSSPEYQRWETATVTKVELWQGQVAGYHIKTDSGLEIVSKPPHMRPSTASPPQEETAAQVNVDTGDATLGAAAVDGPGNGAGQGGGKPAGRILTPPPPAGAGARALAAGSYTCWAANGTAGVLRLVIRGGGQYANAQGTTGRYAYDAASGQITFQSGPWAGFYGRSLGPKKIGLSSRPGGFTNTTCEIK